MAPCSDAAPRPLDVTHVPVSAARVLAAAQEPQRVEQQRLAPLRHAAERGAEQEGPDSKNLN